MKHVFFAMALVATSITAQAGTISDLHNTGAGLSAGAQDPNYSVTYPDHATAQGFATDSTSGYPVSGPWVANTATSAWVTPSSNPNDDMPVVTYDWQTTFDLTGFEAASASFSGTFAADNSAVAFLNGNQIGTSNDFSQWSSFTSQPGFFVAGVNTLDFQVANQGGPTGLRVEFTASDATQSVAAVPEPETYAMLLGGLGALGFVARRRKSL